MTLTADLISRIRGRFVENVEDVTEISEGWSSASDVGFTDEIREILERLVTVERRRDRRATAAASERGPRARVSVRAQSRQRGGLLVHAAVLLLMCYQR